MANLKERVDNLERQVVELQSELRGALKSRGKDWQRTIGAWTGDEEMLGILRDAMRLRNADRKRSTAKVVAKRKPRR